MERKIVHLLRVTTRWLSIMHSTQDKETKCLAEKATEISELFAMLPNSPLSTGAEESHGSCEFQQDGWTIV